MYLKKIRNKIYKYESIRKGNKIVTLYLGKASWFDRLKMSILRYIRIKYYKAKDL